MAHVRGQQAHRGPHAHLDGVLDSRAEPLALGFEALRTLIRVQRRRGRRGGAAVRGAASSRAGRGRRGARRARDRVVAVVGDLVTLAGSRAVLHA